MFPIPIHSAMRQSVTGARADDPILPDRRTGRRAARPRLAPRGRARVARRPAAAAQP